MDRYNNLAFSLFPHHDTSTPMFPNDEQSQCHDLRHDDFHQLPGTTRITRPHTSLSRQAETSLLPQLQRQSNTNGCASQMPVTVPFLVHDQSDGSEPNFDDPSRPSSVSPPSSETCNFGETFPRAAHPCLSAPTPDITSSPLSRSQLPLPQHSHTWPQVEPSMMRQTDVEGNGVPTNDSQYAWASQRVSTVLDPELTPAIAQPTPQVFPSAPLDLPTRRFSETDTLDMQNTPLFTHTPILYPCFHEQSSLSSVTSTPDPQFMDMTMLKTSSPPQCGSLPPMNNDDYFPSSCSEEDYFSVASAPGSPSSVTRSYPLMADYQLAQQPISPSPNYLKTDGVKRRANKRRYHKQPKDMKATRRLQGQRRSDNENIEALRKLFVPKDAEVRWKKDRLGTILHYAMQWTTGNRLVEDNLLESGVIPDDERMTPNDQHLHSHDAFLGLTARRPISESAAADIDMVHFLGYVQPGSHN